MSKFALIVSGCGYLDGAEVSETVLSMLSMSKLGIGWDAFALEEKKPAINHITREPEGERNLLSEAARITRTIQNLDQLQPELYQAIILPGGFGVAKNFSNFGEKGNQGSPHPKIEQLLLSFYEAKKPIGALCIAPALVAQILTKRGIKPLITLGSHNSLVKEMGGEEIVCKADEIAVDELNKIVTTPAFMTEESLAKIAIGIEKLIYKIQELC
jgi:enhancing lycopene biosynthesis protein 2